MISIGVGQEEMTYAWLGTGMKGLIAQRMFA